MIEVGQTAPQFTLEADTGEKVSLKDFAGKRVVLYFYPKDMTPGCTTEACDFRDLHKKVTSQKAVILGISKDSVERHRKFKEKYKLPFLLLSDPDGKVCEAYGVWQKKSFMGRKFMGIVRTTLVISSAGKVLELYSPVKVKDHAQTVLEALAAHN